MLLVQRENNLFALFIVSSIDSVTLATSRMVSKWNCISAFFWISDGSWQKQWRRPMLWCIDYSAESDKSALDKLYSGLNLSDKLHCALVWNLWQQCPSVWLWWAPRKSSQTHLVQWTTFLDWRWWGTSGRSMDWEKKNLSRWIFFEIGRW